MSLVAALAKRSTRLLLVSATQRVPVLSTVTPMGLDSVFAATGEPVRLTTLLVKSAWPRTPSAAAPGPMLAALVKRSTRWLPLSVTQRVPVLSTVTPWGKYSVFAVAVEPPRLAKLLVKSAWPRTPSAFAPLDRLVKRNTRLFEISATKTLPVVGSTAAPEGERSVFAAAVKPSRLNRLFVKSA